MSSTFVAGYIALGALILSGVYLKLLLTHHPRKELHHFDAFLLGSGYACMGAGYGIGVAKMLWPYAVVFSALPIPMMAPMDWAAWTPFFFPMI